MLVVTLALAAVGFALLVVALTTGSVAWAWGCIVVCVIGALMLLVSSLRGAPPTGAESGSDSAPGGRPTPRGEADRGGFDESD